MVPPNNSGAIAKAILKLASDDVARATMGRAARDRVMKHFSFSTSVDQYCALYETPPLDKPTTR